MNTDKEIVVYVHVLLQEDTLGVVKQIHTCGSKKFFLQELCAVAVVQLVNDGQLTGDVIRDHVIPLVGVSSGWEGCTPERLYRALAFNKIVGKVRASWAAVVGNGGSK